MAGAEAPTRKDTSLSQPLIHRLLGHVRGLTKESAALPVPTKLGPVELKAKTFSRISDEDSFVMSIVNIASNGIPLAPSGSITVHTPRQDGRVEESQYLVFERMESSEHVEQHAVRSFWKKTGIQEGEFPTTDESGRLYGETLEKVDVEHVAMGIMILAKRKWPVDENLAGSMSIIPFTNGYEEVRDENEVLTLEAKMQTVTGRVMVD